MEADSSIWQKPGHFYFALTRVEDPWRAQVDCVLAEVDGGRMTSKREVIPR
jgi:hypothetical protein